MTSRVRVGAAAMPLGFLGGGVLDSEGNHSLAIVLVPPGAACLLVAQLGAAFDARRTGPP